ncbi:unnamed protein product, partial [Polarella glacialis]
MSELAGAAAAAPGLFLDAAAFKHFAPLLEASQGYARHSGCRFRSSSFLGVLPEEALGSFSLSSSSSSAAEETEAMESHFADQVSPGSRLAAKVQAAPEVACFARRLRAGEAGLIEEHDRAFRIVMVESVRNGMIATFRRLDIWPPCPAPLGVEDDDCSYEDVFAPIPAIAQRTYNDDVRRLLSVPCDGAVAPLLQRAMTAAFIVDFAHEAGVESPTMPQTQQDMIAEFTARVEIYE